MKFILTSWFNRLLLMTCLGLSSHFATAGVSVGGTRVVYDAAQKEASIAVTNSDKTAPYLIQTWVDNFSENDKNKVPFIVTPPLFRLDAKQENTLRIVYTGAALPQDRESAFWLNVKAIPSSKKTDQNTLHVSLNTRIKLFYRPKALNNQHSSEAYKALTFARDGRQLTVTNPTGYYISFQSLKVGEMDIKEASMIAPKETQQLPLPNEAKGSVSWQTINDYGGTTETATAQL